MILDQADFVLFADYHQFYVRDAGVATEPPTDWTDEDTKIRAKFTENLVVVCPDRDMEVPVFFERHDKRPAIDLDDYNHAVEASISVPSGKIEVLESTGVASFIFDVEPRDYRLVVLYKNLDSIDGARMEGKDSYHLVLFPEEKSAPKILKSHPLC